MVKLSVPVVLSLVLPFAPVLGMPFSSMFHHLEPRARRPDLEKLKENLAGFFSGHPKQQSYHFESDSVDQYIHELLQAANENPVLINRFEHEISQIGGHESNNRESKLFEYIQDIEQSHLVQTPMPAQLAAAFGEQADPLKLSRWKNIWMYKFQDQYGDGTERIFDTMFMAARKNPNLAHELDVAYKQGLNPGGNSKDLGKVLLEIKKKYPRDFETPQTGKPTASNDMGSDTDCFS